MRQSQPTVAALAVLMALGLGCGRDDEQATPAPAVPAAPVVAAPPPAAPRATTEEELVRAVATAIGARDLPALQRTAAPELAADLRRLLDEDAERFWRRGARWVEDVRSGFTIAHRQDDAGGRWNVLVRFGNGHEERITFTRVDGALLIDQL